MRNKYTKPQVEVFSIYTGNLMLVNTSSQTQGTIPDMGWGDDGGYTGGTVPEMGWGAPERRNEWDEYEK